MGARASVILTRKGSPNSPVLAQHWGGPEFHEAVREWAKKQFKRKESKTQDITDRWSEPGRIFVRLVKEFGDGGYIECDRNNVDDSDYGCLYVELADDGPKFSM